MRFFPADLGDSAVEMHQRKDLEVLMNIKSRAELHWLLMATRQRLCKYPYPIARKNCELRRDAIVLLLKERGIKNP